MAVADTGTTPPRTQTVSKVAGGARGDHAGGGTGLLVPAPEDLTPNAFPPTVTTLPANRVQPVLVVVSRPLIAGIDAVDSTTTTTTVAPESTTTAPTTTTTTTV